MPDWFVAGAWTVAAYFPGQIQQAQAIVAVRGGQFFGAPTANYRY